MSNMLNSILEKEWAQVITVASAVGLGYWASSLSESIAGMDLETLVSKFISGIFNDDAGFSVFVNIFIPGILFFLSAGMIGILVYHFFTTRNHDDLPAKVLKWLLTCSFTVIGLIFVYNSLHLLLYAVAIGVLMAFVAMIIVSAMKDMIEGQSNNKSRSR